MAPHAPHSGGAFLDQGSNHVLVMLPLLEGAGSAAPWDISDTPP